MLLDEWNNVQLFAFITYPLLWLIRLFHDSNEGIVLIFRMAYLLFQITVSVYCYVRMKRFGWVRVFPALYYFMTTPYNINGLSYNTLAFGYVFLLVDFRDYNVPIIHVRTWQPEKYKSGEKVSEVDVFSISDFECE